MRIFLINRPCRYAQDLWDSDIKKARETGQFLKSYLDKYPVKPDFGNQMAGQIMNGIVSIMGQKVDTKDMFKSKIWYSPDMWAEESARIITGQIGTIEQQEDILLADGDEFFKGNSKSLDISVRLKLFFEILRREEQDKQVLDVIIVADSFVNTLFIQNWLGYKYTWYKENPKHGDYCINIIDNNKYGGELYGY